MTNEEKKQRLARIRAEADALEAELEAESKVREPQPGDVYWHNRSEEWVFVDGEKGYTYPDGDRRGTKHANFIEERPDLFTYLGKASEALVLWRDVEEILKEEDRRGNSIWSYVIGGSDRPGKFLGQLRKLIALKGGKE